MAHHYYLDCEFKGYQGPLISMSLVRNDGNSIYMLIQGEAVMFPAVGTKDMKLNFLTEPDDWVQNNVLNVIYDCPVIPSVVRPDEASRMLEAFFAFDPSPHIIADYPDDLKYLNELLLVGPGESINVPHMTQEWLRVDAYPIILIEGQSNEMAKQAVRHNAWWDAMALRYLITRKSYNE